MDCITVIFLIDKIKDSKCSEIFDKIYVNNIGIPIKNIYGDEFEIINYSNDLLLYENPTINMMKTFSQQNPNAYILYIHTKGIRYNPDDYKENDWIDYMLYFLVEQHKLCISVLDDTYDVVGCNYSRDIDRTADGWKNQDLSQIPPHYSGNFWWANSNYLRNLPLLCLEKPDRMAPEFWLCNNNPVVYNFHSSQISHFIYHYPRHKYVLK